MPPLDAGCGPALKRFGAQVIGTGRLVSDLWGAAGPSAKGAKAQVTRPADAVKGMGLVGSAGIEPAACAV